MPPPVTLRPPAGQPIVNPATGQVNVAWAEYFQDVADALRRMSERLIAAGIT